VVRRPGSVEPARVDRRLGHRHALGDEDPIDPRPARSGHPVVGERADRVGQTLSSSIPGIHEPIIREQRPDRAGSVARVQVARDDRREAADE
jgi:hypothetical protein